MNYEIGTRLGDYEVVAALGAGGMGQVYKVRNVISDRMEAMKVLLPNLEDAPELADRFLREIKVQASLDHPNIASLHTAIRIDNQLLMLMEFLEGQTLEQRLRGGRIPVADAVRYISQVLSALSYAHARGIIHRDIKPANMMLTPHGVVKLMDFGIAKTATDRRLTMTGTTVGSLYYMSPEQIQGQVDLDARADLYSVGVSLYELVTGKRPFDGDSQFAIMSAHLEKAPVPPLEIDPALSPDLNDIILLAIVKDPKGRFQTADAFRNALGSIAPEAAPAVSAASPSVLPTSIQAKAAPPFGQAPATAVATRGHRGLYVAAGALACALAVVGVIQFGPWKQTSASQFPPETTAAEPGSTATSVAPVNAPSAELPSAPTPEQTTVQAPPARIPQASEPPSRGPVKGVPPSRREPLPASRAVQPGQTLSPVLQSAPPQGLATQPAAAPPQQALPVQSRAAPPPPADAAKTAELQATREHLAMLSGRVAAVRSSLDNLQRKQAASGLGLRGDIVETAAQLNTLLEGAKAALNADDAPSARKFAGQAERQLERLEKYLGR